MILTFDFKHGQYDHASGQHGDLVLMNSNASDWSYIDGCELVNNVSTSYGGSIYMFQKKAFMFRMVGLTWKAVWSTAIRPRTEVAFT